MLKSALKENSSLRSSVSLFGVTVLAQLLSLAGVFLATKNFSQAEFGHFSTFQSYLLIVGTFCLMSLQIAIPNLAVGEWPYFLKGLMIISSLVTISTYIIAALFMPETALPLALGVFAYSLIIVSEQVNIRNKRFGLISFFRPASALFFLILISGATLFKKQGLEILVWSQTFAYIFAGVSYSALSFGKDLFAAWNLRKIGAALKKQKLFALIISPAEAFYSLAHNLPTILIEKHFGPELAGQYSLVMKIGLGPVQVFGSAIGQVFHGRLAESVRTKEGMKISDYYQTRKIFLLLAGAVTTGVFFLYPLIIQLAFGPEWFYSKVFSQLMAPFFGAVAATTSFRAALYVFNRHKTILTTQALYFFCAAGSFALANYLNNIFFGVGLFSVSSTLLMIGVFFTINRLCKNHFSEIAH